MSDATQLSSDLNDVKAITDVEKAEDDPGADAIRGALSIRRFSTVRRSGRATNVDATAGSVNLPQWRSRKDGRFFNNLPSDWSLRESTIREVPAEEDQRKSSVQFDPNAPVTHIYPPRRTPADDKFGAEDDNLDGTDYSSRGQHNPLSPVETPDFRSAPPTPRYNVSKRGGQLQKQFSFGRAGKGKSLTQEETMGLVQAGQNEGGMSESDRESVSRLSEHSEHSQGSDFETHDHGMSGRRGPGGQYDMF